jgi:hypothetical protein
MSDTRQLPKRVTSSNLAEYKLPKRIKDHLDQFEKLREYNSLAGRPAFTAVRMFVDDYGDIQRLIHSQSGGTMSIRQVYWRGLPIISERDELPKLELT